MYHMEYICLSTVSVSDFYKEFCQVLGVSDKGGKTGMFRFIQDQIYYLYKEKRQPLLLAIDEAQYLNTGILNDIKMLMNYGYDSLNCFTLILCGESYLQDTLRKPVHEALNQRITIRYNYEGLSDSEVPELSALVFVRGKVPDADIVAAAAENNLPVLATDYTLFEACGILYGAGIRGCSKKE